MVFAEHPGGKRQFEQGKGGDSPNLCDIWRVSNPCKDTMPPQASPVVDRACRIEKSHTFLPNPGHVDKVEIGQNFPKVKCVLVGDGTIGKTSLIISYTTDGYPTEYVPTAFDNYSVVVTVDNRPIRLQLCDTAGQDDFDQLRPLCYPNTDVFLLCFSVVSPTSFHNVEEKWVPELKKHCPNTPIILVGTQCDLRNDVKVLIELNHYRDKPISEAHARQLAQRIGAVSYMECSALTQINLKQVFDDAILVALDSQNLLMRSGKPSGRKKNSKKSKSKAECTLNNSCHQFSSIEYNSNVQEQEQPKKKGLRKLCCFL